LCFTLKEKTTCHHCACCITHCTHHCSCFTKCHLMGNCWFHCGWWKSWNSTFFKTLKHTQHTSLYFITLFNLQSIFLKALLLMQTEQLCDGIHYLTKHIIIKAWVKMVDSIVYDTINEFPKWDSPPFCKHLTHSLHITGNISQKIKTQNFKNVVIDISCFTIHTIFLWPYILEANNKSSLVGQSPIVLWGKAYQSTFF
jgi:hypothetical protein